MQNNSQKISLFVATILFVFSCIAFSFLFREINKKDEDSAQKLTKLHTEATRRNEIKSLNNSIKIIDNEKTLLETHFAQSSNIVPFLDIIEELAKEVNAKAEVFSVEIVKDNSALIVGVRVSGYFEEIYKFLTLLENSPYELEFVSIDMQKGAAQDPSIKISKASLWSGIFKIKLLSFVK